MTICREQPVLRAARMPVLHCMRKWAAART